MMPPRKIQAGALLLGKALLGQGQGGAVGHQADFAAPPYYLIRDAFTSDVAGGALDGTAAEPGPGVRDVVDTNSKLSASSGVLSFATGGVTSGDPSIQWTPQPRRRGRMMLATVNITTSTLAVGWDENVGSTITDAFRFLASVPRIDVRDNTTAIAVGTFATATNYQVAIILRSAGSFFLIKGGAFTNWTLLYIVATENAALMYPTVAAEGATTVGTADNVSVPAKLWLPSPLVSDGFSAWGESDGLGHAEGVAGGIGSGGGGAEWTAALGTWGAAAGKAAATALSGGIALATASTAVDVVASVKVTRTAGKAGLILRRGGTTNYVYVVVTGTHVQVYKRISNTETNLQDIATTNVDGAALTVITAGTAFRVYYNNLFVVSVTIADAGVQASPLVGLYTTDTANTFDDFTAYARGTDGEYDAILDAI